MKKKLAMLMFIILVSLAFHSCLDYSLPKKIELEVEGSIDLPVNIRTSSWSSALAKALEGAYSGSMENGGLKVYNVNNGQDVQTFCVYIPIEISQSLNPNDHLKEAADSLKTLDGKEALKIDQSITIPSFNIVKTIRITSGSPATITSEFNLTVSSDFRQATIDEGDFNISLNGSPVGNNIIITQTTDGIYTGLDYDKSRDGTSLKDKKINKNPLIITITNSAPSLSDGDLKITMNIKSFSEIDWDITKISQEMSKPASVSLENAAEFMNWIEFAKCNYEKNDLTQGIGINMYFDEIITGLKMTITCTELSFCTDAKNLQKGNNVFGNKEEKNLKLGNSPGVTKLNFIIDLFSSNTDPAKKYVLHLNENLEPGKKLPIRGKATLFQNWEKAEVNIKNALNAKKDDNANADDPFKGQFPAAGEKGIDFSSLKSYYEGFRLSEDGIKAAAYLNGPNKAIKENKVDSLDISKLGLSIQAQYDNGKSSSTVMSEHDLILVEKPFNIGNYLDEKGSYKNKELPPDGNTFNFVDVVNKMPNDLVFHYDIKLPDKIIVTPAMFENENKESVSPNIAANIVLLMDMELTAGEGGGKIKFPDMFKDQRDLLGRAPDKDTPSIPEQNSMFTSLDVEYIKFAIDFTDEFFKNGSLFIEKEDNKILFPEGIPVDGKKTSVNINNENFDIIRKNFIIPDFWLKFKKDGKVTIPRNIGVTSVRIEAKGKNSLNLDF